MRIAVVGGGVSGLTCAVRLLEQGAAVTLITRDPPGATTSATAGAVWFPYRVRPDARTGPWGATSYTRFTAMAAREDTLVTMVELTMVYAEPLREEPWWLAAVPGSAVRECAAAELPEGYAEGRAVRVPCIAAPAYLEWLEGRFGELGGRTKRETLTSLEEADADVIVNCSGVGAGELARDDDVKPVRGQVAYVRPRQPVRFVIDETGPNALAYVLPRPDVTVLGGTAEEGDWELQPRPEATESILARTLKLEPRLAGATYLGSGVGLRPGRSEVRLEPERLPDGRLLVHDYGHGGSGFTLSWGCAEEVASIVLATSS